MIFKKSDLAITIGVLANRANVNVETIRYYQRIGLITTPPKPYSGYRKYDPSIVILINFIKNTQKLGFSLKEIKRILELEFINCSDMKSLFKARLDCISKEIIDLNETRENILKLLDKCNTELNVSNCKIIDILEKKL
jgi:MerR family mercuric resistance operon transcriptional regulator